MQVENLWSVGNLVHSVDEITLRAARAERTLREEEDALAHSWGLLCAERIEVHTDRFTSMLGLH